MFEVPCQRSWPQRNTGVCLLSGLSVHFPKATSNWKCWYNCNLRQNVGGVGTLTSDKPLELELSFHYLKAQTITRQSRERLFSFLLEFQWKFWALFPGCEVAASLSASRLCPKATVVPLGAALVSTVLQPGMQLDFQTNAFWKAKKWFHLIFVPQDHIKALINCSL